MLRPTATTKATLACLSFTAVGILGWLQSGVPESLPLLGFYGVLIANTFFSIQTFAGITPSNAFQTLFDTALVVIYVALAFSFGSVLSFSTLVTVLFVTTVTKYIHLDRIVIAHHKLVQRKIRINVLGLALSALALGIAMLGLIQTAAWVLFFVFTVANIYLLMINPMYRLDS